MTLAASNTKEFTVDELLFRAAQLAGLMGLEQGTSSPNWTQRSAFGRDQLELLLDQMPAECPFTRNVETYTITLAVDDGDPSTPISLPSDTIGVVGDGAYRETSDSTIETPVTQIDLAYWQGSNDKYADPSTPTRMFVRRGATVQLFLLPAAGTAGATLRIQRSRLLYNSSPGSVTLDLERHWLLYLQYEVAALYAMSMGQLNKAQQLKGWAEAKLLAAKNESSPSTAMSMSFDHETGW